MAGRIETLASISRSLLLIAALHFALKSSDRSVLSAVHGGSLACVGSLLYYVLFSLVRNITPRSWGMRTPPNHSSQYQDFERRGRPFLTVTGVAHVVYGLGFVFYVTAYSVASVSVVSTLFLSLSLMVLSYHEVIFPLRSTNPPHIVVICKVVCILLAMWAVVLGIGFDDLTVYFNSFVYDKPGTLLWDSVFPIMTFYVLLSVKTGDNARLGGTWELCEFGIPIMAMLGLMFLVVENGTSFQKMQGNSTLAEQDLVALSVGPLVLLACVWNLLWALFRNSVDEFLIGLSCVSTLARLISTPPDAFLYAGAMCSAGAVLIKVLIAHQPKTEVVQLDILDADFDEEEPPVKSGLI